MSKYIKCDSHNIKPQQWFIVCEHILFGKRPIGFYKEIREDSGEISCFDCHNDDKKLRKYGQMVCEKCAKENILFKVLN